MKVGLSVCAVLCLVLMTEGKSIRRTRAVADIPDAQEYLAELGYYMDNPDFGEDNTLIAISRFQETFGLAVTGTLNDETVAKMNQPRCSNPDTGIISTRNRRTKRYALQGSRWPKLELTYKITQYTRDLPQNEIDVYVRESFRMWSQVTPLRFSRSNSDDADILILFVVGDHGDGGPFDGPGGTYAHAYYPQYGGDAHFDDAERWTIGTDQGVNFFQVCVHEFGHSLGLLHSNVTDSIMEPYYQGYRPGWRLHQDDVDGIHQIYGSPQNPKDPSPTTSPVTSPTTSPTTRRTSATRRTSTTRPTPITHRTSSTTPGDPGDRDVCRVKRWDAVVTVESGVTYFFAGQYYYREGDRRAKVIGSDWSGLPGNIDGAVTLPGGISIFFKDSTFHLFHGQQRYDNRVRQTSHYFPYFPDRIDAAWVWPGNNRIYVTKGLEYWRSGFDRDTKDNYPRIFAEWWPGVPAAADAANRYRDDNLHFFLGNSYLIFDTSSDRVRDRQEIVGRQRSVGVDFFDCEDVPIFPEIPGQPERLVSDDEDNQGTPSTKLGEKREPGSPEELENVVLFFEDPSGFMDTNGGAAGANASLLHLSLMTVIMFFCRL